MALFSSRGVSSCDARPYPDVMAPGELLRTTDLSVGGVAATTMSTGTSYAAAVVSGELALLSQARPSMQVTEREAMLRSMPGDSQPPLLRALGLVSKTERERQP
jgi:subtilisin family serine protease